MTKTTDNIAEISSSISAVEFVKLGDIGLNAAMSSILATNPTVSWAKFILTDSLPNQNGQRVPKEEFDNLIESGLYMPLKMALGEIAEGHELAAPLGVITNLRQEGDQILALAAMWAAERPEDIRLLKSRIQEDSVEISWEILYGHSDLDETGVENLYDLTLKAATIVGSPAYAGRTPVTAIAAKGKKKSPARKPAAKKKVVIEELETIIEEPVVEEPPVKTKGVSRPRKWGDTYINNLSDDSFLYKGRGVTQPIERLFPYKDALGNVDVERLTESLAETGESGLPENVLKGVRVRAQRLLRAIDEANATSATSSLNDNLEDIDLDKLEELTQKVAELTLKSETATQLVTEKTAELDAKTAELTTMLEELEGLREYKASIEEVEAKAGKLEDIKLKFKEAGLNREDEYFTENEETLLSLGEASLEFMIQELVAFAGKFSDESDTSVANTSGIPPLTGGSTTKTDLNSLVEALKKQESEK